jgi:hypothetical protein
VLDERTTAIAGASWTSQLGLLLVEDEPDVLALYRPNDEEAAKVVAWVLVLPDGGAILVPVDEPGGRPIVTTLDNVRRRWTRLMDAELVQVAGRRSLRLAS